MPFFNRWYALAWGASGASFESRRLASADFAHAESKTAARRRLP